MKGFKIGSLFDGSGGFPLAASLCGGVPAWVSEVEPYPIAVTRSRFPTMRHLGDVRKVNGAEVEPVDVITFGSPCQDLSVAGKRAGLRHTANGDGDTVGTITGDHEGRITDYTSVIVEKNKPVFCLQGNGIDRADTAGCNGKGWKEDVCYTLNTIDRSGVAYSIGNGQLNQISMSETCNTLDCMHDKQAVLVAGVDCRNATEYPEKTGTLQAKANGGFSANCNQIIRTRYIVRRLTPTECARLQGFPDDWGHPDIKDDLSDEECAFWQEARNTHAAINGKAAKSYTKAQMLTWYNKLHTDGAEYKMWGNGIALPTVLYVMQGIADALEAEVDYG